MLAQTANSSPISLFSRRDWKEFQLFQSRVNWRHVTPFASTAFSNSLKALFSQCIMWHAWIHKLTVIDNWQQASMLSSSARLLARRAARSPPKQHVIQRCLLSSSSAVSSTFQEDSLHVTSLNSLFNPTDEHLTLRSMLRTFVEREVSGSLKSTNSQYRRLR